MKTIAEKATEAEVESVVYPETSPDEVEIAGKTIPIKPLVRRWQKIFDASALPLFEAELSGPESIIKAVSDGSALYSSLSSMLINSALLADGRLDRAAAIIIASTVSGAEKDPEAEIKKQIEWLSDNARTEDLYRLIDAQIVKERLLMRVGERSPVRFARLLNLAGIQMTEDSLKQFLSNLQSKLQEISNGVGDLTTRKPSISSSAG